MAMDVIPLAADSLGTRSMATLVDTGAARIVIDPGASLAPNRYGLPPNRDEREAYEAAVAKIVGVVCQADAVVVTRYHDDHANLLPYVLSSTAVYLKAPADPAERRQSRDLLERLERTGRAFELVSDTTVNWRDMTLNFSPALPEGESGPAHIMAVGVRAEDFCFVHGSDAQGPLSQKAMEWLLEQKPDLAYLSGAATYRLGDEDSPVEATDLGACRTQLSRLQHHTGCQVILDHLLFRDANFRRYYGDLFQDGSVCSAAAYLGLPERPLEARRRDNSRCALAVLPRLDDYQPVLAAVS
jgi:predicted metallo-beta-lactamase superfamily hydrolase